MAENVKITIKAFDKTKKGFGSVTAGLKRVTSSIFSMRTALVGVAGLAGMGLLIRSSLNATDSLSKTAAKIGTTTEALSALRFAAELTGVATTTMDMAMQRFTRRTAEAAKGTGEAKGALQALGLDAKELVRMPLEERMLALADAFAKEKNEAQKLALAFKLFDSEGAALVVTLGKGRDGLSEMFGEARALGIVMSGDASKGVEDAVDSLTKLKAMFKGVTDQTVAALAPAIAMLTDIIKNKLVKAMGEGEGSVEKFARGMAVSILNGVGTSLMALQKLVNGVIVTFNELMLAKDKLTGFFTADDAKSAGQLAAAIDSVNEKIKVQEKLLIGVSIADKAKKDTIIRLDKEKVALEALLTTAEQTGERATIPLVTFGTRAVAALDPLIEVVKKVNATLDETNKKTGDDGISAWKDYLQSIQDVLNTTPSLEESLKSITKKGIDGLTDSLTAAVTGAAKFSDAMKAMAKSVVDSLIRMLIQKYIVDAAFGFITAGFGGGGGGGGVGTAGTTPGGSGQLAIGGPVQSGGSYLVGERGPEIFSPNASGSIIPNNRLGGGGGVTVNQTINVTTGIQSTVRAEIVSLMPQIAQAAKGAVADARLRGGNFSKAMAGA